MRWSSETARLVLPDGRRLPSPTFSVSTVQGWLGLVLCAGLTAEGAMPYISLNPVAQGVVEKRLSRGGFAGGFRGGRFKR